MIACRGRSARSKSDLGLTNIYFHNLLIGTCGAGREAMCHALDRKDFIATGVQGKDRYFHYWVWGEVFKRDNEPFISLILFYMLLFNLLYYFNYLIILKLLKSNYACQGLHLYL